MNRILVVMTLGIMMSCGAAHGRLPNVILFFADDMGIGDVGAYGCEDIKTPNIDALASAGTRFTNYYSAAPICSPSRAALLTGRYPQHAGVPANVGSVPDSPGMPTEQITIAELAKTRGYATAIIGKWHLGFTYDTQPNAQGFDFFFGHHAGCIDYFSHTFYWDGKAPHHHDLYRNREEIHEEGQYMTHLITREATRFIDDHKDDPFLLYVPYNAPHYPTHAPQRYLDMYSHLPKERQLYASLVAPMDESIGKIIARLRHHDLTENTIVFFMSDNGASVEIRNNRGGGSNGPFRGNKGSLFEGGIRMPAVVSWPGKIPEGQTRDQLTIAVDVFPTVVEIIGAEMPRGHVIDGKSWMTLLKDPNAPGHDTLYWVWKKQHAIRQGKWKLVRNATVTRGMSKGHRPTEGDRIFLADLEVDPGETTNLLDQHPDISEHLLKLHNAWQADISGLDEVGKSSAEKK